MASQLHFVVEIHPFETEKIYYRTFNKNDMLSVYCRHMDKNFP